MVEARGRSTRIHGDEQPRGGVCPGEGGQEGPRRGAAVVPDVRAIGQRASSRKLAAVPERSGRRQRPKEEVMLRVTRHRRNPGMRVLALILLVLEGHAFADVVFLKNGQRLEGDVTEKNGQLEIMSHQGSVTVAKAEVAKTVRALEKYEAEAQEL